MQIYPTGLSKLDDQRALRITWSDGQTRRYPYQELRKRCPCASCREQRKQEDAPSESRLSGGNLLPVISAEEARPLDVVSMKPVGNYAYSIEFSDGHDTGIFTLEFLRELGSPEPA